MNIILIIIINSAILSSILLNEKLGKDGIIGCFLCVLGSLTVILHAPEEDAIETVEDVFHHFTQPSFMLYMMIIIGVSLYLIYKVILQDLSIVIIHLGWANLW